MVWTALREQNEFLEAPLSWPAQFHFENFTRAVGEDVGRWILNSVIVTGGSVILVSIVALMAAYALVRLPFPGSRLLLRVIAALMVVPPVLMLIPMFLMMVTLGRVSHFDSVIVVYAGLMFPFSVYMLVSFIETIPTELYEAAVIDGASHLRMMWSIVVPLTRPALVTLATVNALWAWNELIVAVSCFRIRTRARCRPAWRC
jgi:ABC-type glycerol-3-phosphate transport system permease component